MSATTVYPDHKVITFSIERPAVVERIRARALEEGFEEKPEFHVTLIPSKYGAKLTDRQFDACLAILQDLLVDDINVSEKVFHLQNPKLVDGDEYPRESLISPVSSAQIQRALAVVVDATGVGLDPYLHVTLFTRGDNKHARTGIGIESPQEFEQIVVGQFA